MIDLEELDRLEREATKGPWLVESRGIEDDPSENCTICTLSPHGHAVASAAAPEYGVDLPDAALIVALRNNARELIDIARHDHVRAVIDAEVIHTLRAEVERLRKTEEEMARLRESLALAQKPHPKHATGAVSAGTGASVRINHDRPERA